MLNKPYSDRYKWIQILLFRFHNSSNFLAVFKFNILIDRIGIASRQCHVSFHTQPNSPLTKVKLKVKAAVFSMFGTKTTQTSSTWNYDNERSKNKNIWSTTVRQQSNRWTLGKNIYPVFMFLTHSLSVCHNLLMCLFFSLSHRSLWIIVVCCTMRVILINFTLRQYVDFLLQLLLFSHHQKPNIYMWN